RQKRADRKITDYYEHIKNSGKGKLFYEIIVQFGDINDCGVGSENWNTAKNMLNEYMQEFEKRNPNLKVFNAVMHLDESTPHLHIDFVPVARRNKKGLSVKNSMSGALREQGFSSSNRMQNEWTAWSESERSYMEQILHKHSLLRDDKNIHREHLSVEEYKERAHRAEELHRIQTRITELKKKSTEEYSAEEITLIKNQNDFLRSEITKRNETISALSEQIGAKFVPVDIFNEDKLQYIADGLTRAKIPFVAESSTLYIPDYGLKTANAISRHYKPTANATTIRDSIAFDIDRLVYASESVEDLLNKLKERGYEVKHGKYIAVKAPNAERFVRLKSLGEDYLPKQLEKRIAERDKFTDIVRKKMNASSDFDRKFYVSVLETTVAVKQFRLTSKKIYPKEIYSYYNDENIRYLAAQLKTIGEFSFTSSESIYAKAQELQRTIRELQVQNRDTQSVQLQLQRVKELAKAYERIVEGNYVDNLIKAQRVSTHKKVK
ncbi:MAG: plasmid recombination protein, partial [Oscillospiraceae bacterium]|nr:plasmid recombination protein [Oscillospiraceae bacterium]